MTTIYKLMEKEKSYDKMLEIVKRAAQHSCCLCDDCCLACDAAHLLKELKENE